MHDALFADAARPKRAKILGLLMLDYTIGHELVLWQRRNPLVTHDPVGFSELSIEEKASALAQVALLCCHQTPRWMALWEKLAARMDLDTEIHNFRNYRAGGSLDLPCVAMPKTPGVPFHYFGAPELARLINYVSENHSQLITAHFEGSPFNFSYGLARMLYTTAMECEGNVWVKNWQDEEKDARLAALEAKEARDGTVGFAVGDEAVRKMAEQWNQEHPDAPVPMPEAN